LLADENGTSIKVAKYSGTDRVDLIENNEYGYCSLIKATKRVIDKLELENKNFKNHFQRTHRHKTLECRCITRSNYKCHYP
jgi:hypothetical protein